MSSFSESNVRALIRMDMLSSKHFSGCHLDWKGLKGSKNHPVQLANLPDQYEDQ